MWSSIPPRSVELLSADVQVIILCTDRQTYSRCGASWRHTLGFACHLSWSELLLPPRAEDLLRGESSGSRRGRLALRSVPSSLYCSDLRPVLSLGPVPPLPASPERVNPPADLELASECSTCRQPTRS